jgi:dTDP-4-amino-4,6-dideoxygalactose transaminase
MKGKTPMEKIYVTRPSMPPFEEYAKEIKDIWDSHWLTNFGEKHSELEAALNKYLEVKNTSLFCNGHLALEACLEAFELSGEVITVPFTFASTTHAIIRKGLTPVFCDIREDNLTIDTDKIESLITPKTTAILAVHVYGNICDTKKIELIAKKHNLKVIYDAAHAFGVKVSGIGAGSFGDASVFSFHATKVFNTIEGGAVCFGDDALESKLYLIKNFGIRDEETITLPGGNAKMNEFSAAMGICNLRYVDEEIAKREKIYLTYRKHLEDVPGLIFPKFADDVMPNFAYLPVLIDKNIYGLSRDEAKAALAKQDIFARKYFYPLTNTFDYCKENRAADTTPIAEKVSRQVLTLPIYTDLSETEILRICDVLRKENSCLI